MGYLDLYKKVKQPPAWAQKIIGAGRLKGKTDINPQWRYEVLTENFGICGVGWKYIIKKLWLEKAGDEMLSFAEIDLYIKNGDTWSDPIPGIGGNKMIAKEKESFHNSDECFKMSVTDALSVACKMLGIGADIYSGGNHDSKYEKTNMQLTPAATMVPDAQKMEEYAAMERIKVLAKGIMQDKGWSSDMMDKTLVDIKKIVEKNYLFPGTKISQAFKNNEEVIATAIKTNLEKFIQDLPF
jgi:hypothetical protein